MIVYPKAQIRPRLYKVGAVTGAHADLLPISIEAQPLQWPVAELRRHRLRSTDDVSMDEQQVRVVRILNPFDDDLFRYEVETADGEIVEASELELNVHEESGTPDPADMLAQGDVAPLELVRARMALLEAYFAATAKSLGIVGYNGARMLPIPHQINAARYALQFGRIRFLLADEVGLGKTVEAGLIAATLRKYFPEWQTAIFTPESLTAQWAFEMYGKFGKQVFALSEEEFDEDEAGVILPHQAAPAFAENHEPEILIVDEAHRVLRHPAQVEALARMSAKAHAVLLLTATPVSDDTLNLLRLLHLLDHETFGHITTAEQLRTLMARQGEMERVLAEIRTNPPNHDRIRAAWAATGVDDAEIAAHLAAAGDDVAGRHDLHRMAALIVDRYYPGARILRYRRKFLIHDNAMPMRIVEPIEYKPTTEETTTTAAVEQWLRAVAAAGLAADPMAQATAAALVQAAHSSALAVDDWVRMRRGILEPREGVTADPIRLARRSMEKMPALPGEEELLESIAAAADKWARATRALDATLRPLANTPRFKAFLAFLRQALADDPTAHILVFTSFEANVHPLYLLVRKALADVAEVYEMHGAMSRVDREKSAFEFQDFAGGSVLISDDLGGEGRNFQFASHVVHYDLPLAPWMVEQRIGRCDRVGREEELDVDSQVIVSKGGLDEAFFDFLAEGVGVFNESIAPIEAMLDRVVHRAMEACIDRGAAGVLDLIEETAAELDEARERENADLVVRGRVGVEEARAVAAQLDDSRELDTLGREMIRYARLFDSMVDEQEGGRLAITVGEFHTLHGVPGVRGEMIGYFNRREAVRHERLDFFSPGHPFVRSMALAAMLDSPDRCAVIRRRGITQPAFLCFFRIQLPLEFLEHVRAMPADLRPPLLSRSAALFPTQVLRIAVTTKGQVIPRVEKYGAYYELEQPDDAELADARGWRALQNTGLVEMCPGAGALAIEAAEDVAAQILAAKRPEFEDLVCEVITRVHPAHELAESQIDSVMDRLDMLTVEFDAMLLLVPAR
jgi:ATP-dependent helicase HepA